MNENIAVYIDADNANSDNFLMIYNEIKKYGNIIIGRIYGDWTNNQIKSWKDISINYSFQTMNCFSIAKKNSTDIYLICDLIDDLHKNNNIDIFIIVSSDSDFTEPARRIRAHGKKVFGIGKKETNKMLKNSCDKFIIYENLQEEIINKIKHDNVKKKLKNKNEIIKKDNNKLIHKLFKDNKILSIKEFKIGLKKLKLENIKLNKNVRIIDNNVYYIKDILDTIQDLFENTNKNILGVGFIKEILIRKDSSFDQRSYGFKSMKTFISKIFQEDFEIIFNNCGVFIKNK